MAHKAKVSGAEKIAAILPVYLTGGTSEHFEGLILYSSGF